MKTERLILARRLFINNMAPRHIARHNMRAWVRSIRMLGKDWVGLARDMQKQHETGHA